MGFRVSTANFSKGELAPELIARTDVEAYGAGVRKARNVIVRKYGGLTKRPGTRFVAEVFDSTKPVRLMPFQFSIEQAYALEMGQGYMRACALGGVVLNEELAITSITQAVQAQVGAALHGYMVGDQVYFSGVAGMTQINGLIAKVASVVDADHFTVALDTTGFSAFTSATGGITRTAPPPAPPEPPTVPPVVTPPTPPSTGGGGGFGNACPADDEMWLLANEAGDGPGIEVMGRDLNPAVHRVWTMHEHTGVWGAHQIVALRFVEAEVMRADALPQALPGIPSRPMRATADHPMRWPDATMPWFEMQTAGVPDGRARVVQASIEGAHTMVINGVLSHNKLAEPSA